MNIFLLILAGIIAVIDLLIFCPVVVKIEFREKLKIKAGYLFPIIPIPTGAEADPEKAAKKEAKKAKREEKKRLKEEKRRLKYEKKHPDAAAEEEQTRPEKKENVFTKILKEDGVKGIIELIKELARIVGGLVNKITDHLTISKFDLDIAVSSEDAAKTATTYSYICTAVYPSVSFISEHVRKCRHKIRIAPVFTREKTQFRLVLKARISPFFVLSAALGAGIKALKLFLKKKK